MGGTIDFSATPRCQLHLQKGLFSEGRGDALPQVSTCLQQPMAEEACGWYNKQEPSVSQQIPWPMTLQHMGQRWGKLCRGYSGLDKVA